MFFDELQMTRVSIKVSPHLEIPFQCDQFPGLVRVLYSDGPSDVARDQSVWSSDGTILRSLKIRYCECPRQVFDVLFLAAPTDQTAAVVQLRKAWPANATR